MTARIASSSAAPAAAVDGAAYLARQAHAQQINRAVLLDARFAHPASECALDRFDLQRPIAQAWLVVYLGARLGSAWFLCRYRALPPVEPRPRRQAGTGTGRGRSW